jgi:SAM-dependent methyltransferase
MTADHDRARLAATFDQAAGLYQRARPEYPGELFGRLIEVTGLVPGDRLLEIGCATGKATLPLARRGFRITCLEPGPHLAAAARHNLAGLAAEVVESRFEDWRPARPEEFALVFAATSWHWIDPAHRYALAWRALRPGGHLAFWSAVDVYPGDRDPFFAELQEVYDEIGEGVPSGGLRPRPEELPDHCAEITSSGWFTAAGAWRFGWVSDYGAESYIDLLSTFSGHIAMEPWQRDRLYGEIRRRLGRRPGGTLRRHWGAVLTIARRRDSPRVCGQVPRPG